MRERITEVDVDFAAQDGSAHVTRDTSVEGASKWSEHLEHRRDALGVTEVERVEELAPGGGRAVEESVHRINAGAEQTTKRALTAAGRFVFVKTAIVAVVAGGAGAAVSLSNREAPPAVAPEPAPMTFGELEVDSIPTGATLYLDDRAGARITPMTFSLIPYGQRLKLRFEKEGFLPVEREVIMNEESDRLRVVVALEKVPEPAVARAVRRRAAAPRECKRLGRNARGRLSFESSWWSSISIDGGPELPLPLVGQPVPAGCFQVRVYNDVVGPDRVFELEVDRNKAAKYVATLTRVHRWE